MLLRFLNQDMAVYMTSITEIAPFRYGPRAASLAWPAPASPIASPALIVRPRYAAPSDHARQLSVVLHTPS